MSSDNHHRNEKKFPLGGVLVLALGAGALLLFTSADASWNPLAATPMSAMPMELSGQWLGMRLAAPNTTTAQSLGAPPTVQGVVITEVAPSATRAQQAGVMPGDVLVNVDGTTVTNLTDLYALTTQMDSNRALPIAVTRQGQPLNLIVPPPPGMVGTPGGFGGPAVAAMNPAMLGSAVVNPTMPMTPAWGVPPAAATPMQAQPAPAQGPMYYCPNDGLFWNHAQVAPGFHCPRCGGALAR